MTYLVHSLCFNHFAVLHSACLLVTCKRKNTCKYCDVVLLSCLLEQSPKALVTSQMIPTSEYITLPIGRGLKIKWSLVFYSSDPSSWEAGELWVSGQPELGYGICLIKQKKKCSQELCWFSKVMVTGSPPGSRTSITLGSWLVSSMRMVSVSLSEYLDQLESCWLLPIVCHYCTCRLSSYTGHHCGS